MVKTQAKTDKPEFSFKSSFVTPRGTAKYPHLKEPDEFKGKKTYKITIVLDTVNPKVQEFIDELEAANNEVFEHYEAEYAGKKAKNGKPITIDKYMPVTPVLDDDGEETSKVQITLKMNYQKQDGTINHPAVLDSKRKPLSKTVAVYGGSEVKGAGYLYPFCQVQNNAGQAGVTLKLSAVQVLKLVTGQAGSFGFDEEDGFEFDGTEEESVFGSEGDQDEENLSASEF